MKLTNLKITKADRDARTEPASMATESPAYPWGLSITLDDDVLEKLGCAIGDFKVGASLMIVANVEVTSVSSSETRGAGNSRSVGLQITDLGLEDEAGKVKAAAKALYGDGD